MKIKLLKSCKEGNAGDVVTMDSARAERMIGCGQAAVALTVKEEGRRPTQASLAEESASVPENLASVPDEAATEAKESQPTKPKAGGKNAATRPAGG